MAELLTVLAILALLAGVLFPVFSSVKAQAKKAQCLSDMHQVQLATSLYMDDYGDTFVPVNHRPGAQPNSKTDRTWVQLILPYASSFAIFNCPADSGLREKPETTFDQDLVPGDIYSKYYTASLHVNVGYNYLYLSPVVRQDSHWAARPKTMGEIEYPSNTLLYVDSVWNRTASGLPYGGGNWLVVPPCRYTNYGIRRIDTFGGEVIYSPFAGWKKSDPNSGRVYGNAWPWHNGRVNIARVDGSVKALSVNDLSAGCVVEDNWLGAIRDPGSYLWDTQ